MRPAVNVGISVSRVGGDAQTKAMKKAAGSVRIDLAQYRELESFTQFSSDLDDTTKAQLAYGQRLMELLKQPVHSPMSMADQVITLVCAENSVFKDVSVKDVKKAQGELLQQFKDQAPDIVNTIMEEKTLSDDLKQKIIDTANDFMQSR